MLLLSMGSLIYDISLESSLFCKEYERNGTERNGNGTANKTRRKQKQLEVNHYDSGSLHRPLT